MSWNVKITQKVLKEIKRFPQKDAKRLLFVLEEMSKNPYRGDIEKVKGEENVWRRRLGSYRILYEMFPPRKFIWVFDIKRRTTTTY